VNGSLTKIRIHVFHQTSDDNLIWEILYVHLVKLDLCVGKNTSSIKNIIVFTLKNQPIKR